MASEATSYREGVEQMRRRFAEFRQAHAARSRLPEELWAAAARLARRDGITATAQVLGVDRPESSKVDGSIGAARFHKVAEVSAPAFAGGQCRARLRGAAGGQHGNDNQVWWRSNRPATESYGWI